MSLAAMLAAHEPAALEALANKGLVRRAARDAEAGRARIDARDDETATVIVEDMKVRLTQDSPRPSDCPCPATGLCRHILTAILALRDTDQAPQQQIDARAALRDMPDADLVQFAGSDLQAALALAATGPQITQEGGTLRVAFADFEAPVQFIPGRGPQDAVFKGPASRARLVKAAAVLALKFEAGRHLEAFEVPSALPTGLSAEFLDQVAHGLATLVTASFRGGAMAAIDQVFDLAISARAQAAPRLTGLLRGLVAQARLAGSRHVDFDPERFLAEAALGLALTEALRSAPSDVALLGTLQRAYLSAPALTFWALGAEQWHAPSGARGLRIFGYDPEAKRWLMSGDARAAGADPTFSPRRAYGLSLMGAGRASDLIGCRIEIPDPRISEDFQLAPTTMGRKSGAFSLADLSREDLLISDWDRARADLHARRMGGLRSRDAPLPILLAPRRIEMRGFDDIGQAHVLTLTGVGGDTLTLLVSAKQADIASWLIEGGSKIAGLLCLRIENKAHAGLLLTPVAALTESREGLAITNLALDPLPGGQNRLAGLKKRWRGAAKTVRPSRDPLKDCADAVLRYLVDALSGGRLESAALEARLDAAGLDILADALARFNEDPEPANALRAAYVADRIAAIG